MRKTDVRDAIAHEVTRAYDNYMKGIYSYSAAMGALSVCSNLAATVLYDIDYMQYIVGLIKEIKTIEDEKPPIIYSP